MDARGAGAAEPLGCSLLAHRIGATSESPLGQIWAARVGPTSAGPAGGGPTRRPPAVLGPAAGPCVGARWRRYTAPRSARPGRSGGIGRRGGFKIHWGNTREGSSPSSGTCQALVDPGAAAFQRLRRLISDPLRKTGDRSPRLGRRASGIPPRPCSRRSCPAGVRDPPSPKPPFTARCQARGQGCRSRITAARHRPAPERVVLPEPSRFPARDPVGTATDERPDRCRTPCRLRLGPPSGAAGRRVGRCGRPEASHRRSSPTFGRPPPRITGARERPSASSPTVGLSASTIPA